MALQLSWAGLAFYVNDLTGMESQCYLIFNMWLDRVANMAGYAAWHGTPSNCCTTVTHPVEIILVYGNGVGEFFTEVVG